MLSTALLACLLLSSLVASSKHQAHPSNAQAANHRRFIQRHNEASSRKYAQKRSLLSGWSYVGCYNDPGASRLLAVRVYAGSSNTQESCVTSCSTAGYSYAGVEYGQECWCGNSLNNPQSASSSSCNMACSGNSAEKCGAGNVLSLYQYTPTTTWTSLGCIGDQNARTLNGASTTSSALTTAMCQNFCAQGGFTYAGTEYGTQCYCGNSLIQNIPSSACSSKCGGGTTDICGGSWALSVYKMGSSSTGSTSSASTSSTTTTSSTSPQTTSSRTATSSATATSSVAATASLLGCYQDQPSRTLNSASTTDNAMTPAKCQAWCASQGSFSYFGVEYSKECYCGTGLTTNTPLGASNCNAPCGGDPNQICGGLNWQISIYKIATSSGGTTSIPSASSTSASTTTSATTTTSTSLSTAIGCYQDQAQRTLNGPSTINSAMTPAVCKAFCATQGSYQYYGTENHQECYCGNALTTVNALTASSCTATCAGDPTQICGGTNWALSLFSSTGSLTPPTPPGFSAVGCFVDSNSRLLPVSAPGNTNYSPMTCRIYCNSQGFPYAGLENGSECYCGLQIVYSKTSGTIAPSTDCSTTCAADGTQGCGGVWRLSIYYSAVLDQGACLT